MDTTSSNFYSYPSAKREKATNNENNNDPSFKNRLAYFMRIKFRIRSVFQICPICRIRVRIRQIRVLKSCFSKQKQLVKNIYLNKFCLLSLHFSWFCSFIAELSMIFFIHYLLLLLFLLVPYLFSRFTCRSFIFVFHLSLIHYWFFTCCSYMKDFVHSLIFLLFWPLLFACRSSIFAFCLSLIYKKT